MAKWYIYFSEDDDEPLEVEDRPAPLTKLQIFFLNVSWYGLSTMFLVLSVVGKQISSPFIPHWPKSSV